MYCISVRSFLLQAPPWHQKLLGKDGSMVTKYLLCYICVLCLPAQVAQVSFWLVSVLPLYSWCCFCCFSGTAFKTQKEVVKAIFVNNIERLGHHYARVFDESWWISSPVSGSLNVNKCIVTDSEVCFVLVWTYLDQLLYGTYFLCSNLLHLAKSYFAGRTQINK